MKEFFSVISDSFNFIWMAREIDTNIRFTVEKEEIITIYRGKTTSSGRLDIVSEAIKMNGDLGTFHSKFKKLIFRKMTEIFLDIAKVDGGQMSFVIENNTATNYSGLQFWDKMIPANL